jgi:hypothetical protein
VTSITCCSPSPHHSALSTTQCLKLVGEISSRGIAQVWVIRRCHVYLPSYTYSVDGHRDQPQAVPTQPPQGESNLGDSSVPLFSLYSKIAEEEDNKLTDRWQKDADGILIFVSVHTTTSVVTRINGSTRPVFSLRPSPRYFPCPYRTSGPTLWTLQFILRTSTRFSLIRTSRFLVHQFLLPSPSYHHLPLRDMPSG